jgi:hypothetical protein
MRQHEGFLAAVRHTVKTIGHCGFLVFNVLPSAQYIRSCSRRQLVAGKSLKKITTDAIVCASAWTTSDASAHSSQM